MIKRIIYILVTLSLICGAALFYLDSRIPRATATLQVHPTPLPTAAGKLYSGHMEGFFHLILSPETMNLAADRLNIPQQDRAEVIAQMTKNVTAKPLRGTDFFEITAKDPDRKQAAKIANVVAHAAIQHRNEFQVIRANKFLERLDAEIASTKALLKNHRSSLQKILKQNNLPFPTGDTPFPSPENIPLLRSSYSKTLNAFTDSHRTLGFKMDDRLSMLPYVNPEQPPFSIHQLAE